MRMISLMVVLVLLSPVTVAAPARPAANLITNGSFEEGPEEIGTHKPIEKGSDAIKGWKVTRGQIDLVGTFFGAFEGKRTVDLHGSPGYGGLEQVIKTKKGKRYLVELQLAATPGAGEREIWVAAAGDRKKFAADPGESTREKLKWVKVSWEFAATDAETTFEIYTSEKGDDCQGPIIDDVVVREK